VGAHGLQRRELALHVLQRGLAGHGLDAADAAGHAPLAHDPEQPDLAGRADVRPAAELDRDLGVEGDDADGLAVLLAEERHRAAGLRLGERDAGLDARGDVLEDPAVHAALDLPLLLGRDPLEVREVEAEAVRGDERALLLDVRAEHLAQRGVEEVGGGVVLDDAAAAVARDERGDGGLGLLGEAVHLVRDGAVLEPLRVDHPQFLAVDHEHAGVADLPAGLRVERGLVEDHLVPGVLARAERPGAADVGALDLDGAVPLKGGVLAVRNDLPRGDVALVDGEGAGRAGALALLSMSSEKRASSTASPSSRAIRAVRSPGKP
jgi:hypothetical protein